MSERVIPPEYMHPAVKDDYEYLLAWRAWRQAWAADPNFSEPPPSPPSRARAQRVDDDVDDDGDDGDATSSSSSLATATATATATAAEKPEAGAGADDERSQAALERRLLAIGFTGIRKFLADANPVVVWECLLEVEAQLEAGRRGVCEPVARPAGLLRYLVVELGGAPKPARRRRRTS